MNRSGINKHLPSEKFSSAKLIKGPKSCHYSGPLVVKWNLWGIRKKGVSLCNCHKHNNKMLLIGRVMPWPMIVLFLTWTKVHFILKTFIKPYVPTAFINQLLIFLTTLPDIMLKHKEFFNSPSPPFTVNI